MADKSREVWRRAVEANVRYYQAWSRIANEYLNEVGAALKTVVPQLRLPSITFPTNAPLGRASDFSTVAVSTAVPPTAVVMEGPPGSVAQGAVVVENHLSHRVSAAVRAQVDSDIEIAVEPEQVDLGPGESVVVKISARLPVRDSTHLIEVSGQLHVPELVGTAVPLLIRSFPLPVDLTTQAAD